MAKNTVFVCEECGEEQIAWMGRCPACGAWGSLREMKIDKTEKRGREEAPKKLGKAKRLSQVAYDLSKRIPTGISELDRVLGGGLVKDSLSILTARPGAGKSTLLLELSGSLAKEGLKVLYVSGEESESQIKMRAERILEDPGEDIFLLSTTSMDAALDSIEELDPDFVVLDSIQTMELAEFSQRAGSPTQTVECTNRCVEVCKGDRPRAMILVGHMTKNDEMAGLRTLEHLVDTVLYLEGESDESLRLLRSTKNRFGFTGEIGLFEMSERGLKEMTTPQQFFLTQREKPVPGVAVTVVKEGSRLLSVEIEALVSQSFTPYPIRIGDSLRKDQLNTLVSILEQSASFSLWDKNVILKVTGGLKLSEQSGDLAILCAIVSSQLQKPIPNGVVFLAEVGLTGELKRIPQLEQRLREMERLGFQEAYVGPVAGDFKLKTLKVKKRTHLQDVLRELFGEQGKKR